MSKNSVPHTGVLWSLGQTFAFLCVALYVRRTLFSGMTQNIYTGLQLNQQFFVYGSNRSTIPPVRFLFNLKMSVRHVKLENKKLIGSPVDDISISNIFYTSIFLHCTVRLRNVTVEYVLQNEHKNTKKTRLIVLI